jgi:hypothetical protein
VRAGARGKNPKKGINRHELGEKIAKLHGSLTGKRAFLMEYFCMK